MAANPTLDDASVDALLDEWTAIHQRVQRGYAALLAKAGSGDADWERAADERWQRVRRQHQDCARAVTTTIPRQALVERRDKLLGRLAKGWTYVPADVEQRAVADEHFDALLARYEAIAGALEGALWLEQEIARRTRLVMAARSAQRREAVRA